MGTLHWKCSLEDPENVYRIRSLDRHPKGITLLNTLYASALVISVILSTEAE